MILFNPVKLFGKILLLCVLFILSSNTYAGWKYWVAANDGTTKYWNDNANWSNSRTGSPGAAYPRVGHKVIFNSRSTVDCTLRATAQTRRLNIWSNYTGTINLAGFNMYSKQGAKIYGGTFEVPSGSKLSTSKWNSVIGTGVTVNAENGTLFFGKGLTIQGTLNAPSGNLTVRGKWANSGTFTHNSGTVIFNPRASGYTITPGGTGSTKAFYNVKKVGNNKIIKLAGAISLNNFELAYKGGTWRAQGNAMTVGGNWKVGNRSAYTHGNNTVTFSGSSSQEINVYPSKGDFYNLEISNTAATVSADSNAIVIDNTLTIDSNATLDIEGQNLTTATLTNNGNLQLQGGETVAITTMDTNSGTVTYDGTGTYTQLAAGDAYYNLTLNSSSGSITLDANLDVNGDLTITDGKLDVSSNNRSINVAGNWSNSDTFDSRSGTVTFDGSSTVTTGGIVDDKNDFHHVILSGSATQSTNKIDIDGDFTISSSGTWDTSNLCMYVSGTTTTGSGTLTNAVATLSSTLSSPADGATEVAVDANIVLTFSEAVDVESGNIVIKKTSDDSTVETIAVTDEDQITGTGTDTITINPSVTLASETGYYLTIAATAFDDCSSKSYAGITNKATHNFTTAVGDPPTLSSTLSSPADDATGVSATANIVLKFSEAVDVESGNIVIKKTSDDTTVETIAVTDEDQITGTGTDTITINPSVTLASAAGYYLTIAATAFDDSSSNSYVGITNKTTYNFTTANTGCTVEGVAETGQITRENLDKAIATGTDDVTTCDVSAITDMSRLFYLKTTFNQDISAWNPVSVTDMSEMFYIAASFNRDISGWNTGAVTNMSKMFHSAIAFNNGGVALDWSDTSKVTDMSHMFNNSGADAFNQDISAWNTGAVTDMSHMFYKADDFNQDISDWNTGAVTNMSGMFYDAEAFNNGGVALDWSDTSKVTDMSYMFWYADAFNQDVSGWNTGAVTNMSYMFYGYNEKAFNNGGVVLDWSDTSKVTDMNSMFFNADAFNQDVSGWNTGAVTNMSGMFFDADAFNNGGVVLDWSDTSKVTNMSQMFRDADVFNQDVSGWNTGAVTTMYRMFEDADAFNNGGVALDWSDTSKVTRMDIMFKDADVFNQDVSGWNTGAVTTMSNMFNEAVAFNQDVSAWDVRKVTDMSRMFYGDTLSTANYDALLIAWNALELWDDVAFHGGNSKYTTDSDASAARANMIATDGDNWTITDGGAIPSMTIIAAEVFDGATSNDTTLSLTFTSSEATSDFVVGDITVAGGSLSSFAASSSTVYTATFTPTTEGATTIDVQAAKFTSTYGANDNTAATQFNWTYSTTTSDDTTAPTITFSPADSATGVAVTSNITLTFSEAIRNTDDSALTSSTVGSLITLKNTNSSGSDINFVATIDAALKVITINPNSDFSSEQVVYVAIGATVEDFFDNAITPSSISFTAADSTAPTLVFDPEDLESAVPVADNITLTFNEAIRNTNDSALNNTNVDSLITLKDSDASGSDIDFNATIDNDNKVITINPDSSFSSEQVVYVAIGATVEDASDNAISESSIIFNVADATAPNVEFTPVDSATGIAVNSDITIAFDEVIRNTDDSALTDSNVDSLITLKTTNSSGSDIDFDAVIDDSKQLITISPSSDFSSEQVIYVAIGATVEDASDNAISASSITFTAADSTAPTVAFVPPDTSSCIPISSNVSLTFSEAVRNPDDSAITNANVGDIITLEYRSDSSPVAFTATINSAKTVITINPDSDFVSGEVISVAIESVEDTSNNTMSATSGTFCVVDSTAPTIEFSPADLSTMVAEDTDIILTFDEEIRLTNDSALNNTNVDSLITLKDTNGSGSDIAFDATIDSDNKVITIDLVSNLSSNQIVYVAIGETVEDSYNNAITAASATFTTGDSLPPTVKIEAAITASIATDSNITFTFSEAVRNLDDTELTNSNVGSLMTLKDTDANGSDIPFSATINPAKTIITINPTSNFTSQQVIYAAIGATVEDDADNVVPASSKTFIAEYLATSLSNPLDEKDVVGLIEAQLETAERFIDHSTIPILKRMEWLRRHRDGNNLSNQGININFANSILSDIANAFQLSSFVNKTADLFQNDWAIWSEGSVTIGEIDATRISSIKEIKSKGITIGMDKMIDKNQMYGAAFRIENDDNDIGTSGSKLDTDGYSLSLYGTFPFSEKTFIDSTLGVGILRTELTRKHDSGTLSGKRKGKQLFGSVLYGAEFNNNQLTLSPYGRLDAGYTKLSSYTDSGTVAAISYNEQKIKTARASIGLLMDDEVKIGKANFMPNARVEYGKDIIDSSDAVVSYIVYPNTDYTLNIDKEENDNFRLGFGADIEVENGWLFMADYERNQTDNSGYENTISLGVSFQPNSRTEYSLSLIDGDSSNGQIGLDFNKRLSEDWSINAGFEIAQTSSSGYNNTAQFSTEMSF